MEGTDLSKANPKKVTIDRAKLNFFDQAYIKEIEEKNRERVKTLLTRRRNNRITAALLGLGVLGIYGYTIKTMKQETFLDDFDPPETIHD